jgi:radical SAM superfamily enzyme YgiQ (UPF0313 family)
MRIYLADLGHNQVTYTSDIYPLGVANLAAYAQTYAELKQPLEIRIFREPQDLKQALDSASPDILGVSSYAWNHRLSLHFASYAKQLNSATLTIMGGPNFPLVAEEQETFLRGMPQIDVAVRGPTYEGERAFLNVVQRFAETDLSRDGFLAEPIAGSKWIDPRTDQFVQGSEINRILDLDEIPSPYLAGLMDPYFDTGYFPMMQISRGCPFTCAFCNSSVRSNSKIYSHSLENVKADLLYIAQRVKKEAPLCFADDNFGMYELDEEVADYLVYLQDTYDWPQYIRTTTGKNKHERIIRVMRKVRGRLPMTSAVQSLNPVVLKNIERSNISLDSYSKIQEEVLALGMQAYGELILCLPGETKASIMEAMRDLLEAGVKRISAHQLMLLPGAPLSNADSREKWGFQTRFRVVARNIGTYIDEPDVELEEIVVETPTFSFEDYLETRVFHLLLTIYFYEGNFEEAFEFARQTGIKPYHLIQRLQSMLKDAPPRFQQLIDDFLAESKAELFPSEQACIEWSRNNMPGLLAGDIGGNLLSKYSMIGRFYITQDTLDFLEMGIIAEGQQKPNFNPDALKTVIDYLRVILLHVPFISNLDKSMVWTTNFDLETWRDERYTKDLEIYVQPEPLNYQTSVAPERKAVIANRITTFGEHPTGLGKFTRTMFAQDLRRTLVRVGGSAQNTE